jgi:outer membrane immunogenic protein
MRRAAAAIAVFACFFSAAHAADMPPGPPAYRAAAVAPAFSWSGVYAGANAGYGFATVSDTAGFASDRMDGALAGGQVGAQWQSGAFVAGVEGDVQASWQQRSVSGTIGGIAVTAKEDVPWFATARFRAGFAFDRALVYATAGGAYTNFQVSATALGVTVSSTASRAAWTAGGGVEYMFADRWSGKLEYLYIDTGDVTVTLLGVPLSGRLSDNIVRAGINYHF